MTTTYQSALQQALRMMEISNDLEPTSALKQAASDCGIQCGDQMRAFIKWAYTQLGI